MLPLFLYHLGFRQGFSYSISFHCLIANNLICNVISWGQHYTYFSIQKTSSKPMMPYYLCCQEEGLASLFMNLKLYSIETLEHKFPFESFLGTYSLPVSWSIKSCSIPKLWPISWATVWAKKRRNILWNLFKKDYFYLLSRLNISLCNLFYV